MSTRKVRYLFLGVLALAALLYTGPGVPVGAAFPGPNGKIVFSSNRDGDYDIYTISPDGGDPELLADVGPFDSHPAWSPDGSKVAFSGWKTGAPAGSDIFVVNADGSGLINLTNNAGQIENSQPAWSPDGSLIAYRRLSYTTGLNQLYVMDAAQGGNKAPLTEPETAPIGSPVWSPTAGQIAFVSHRELNAPRIFVMDGQGHNEHRLTTRNRPELDPSYSPDGQEIVFGSDGNLYTVNYTGGAVRALRIRTEETWYSNPVWSPDGERFALHVRSAIGNDGGDIFTMLLDGTDWRPVTNDPGQIVNHALDWQPTLKDSDADGLSNALEIGQCYSALNPDSDRDGLLDGWEVLGKRFPDGELIDLPAMGANPCRRDVFLQLDWETGVEFSQQQLNMAVNIFRQRGVTLHLSGFERPAPPVGTVSTIYSADAMALKDAGGNYYFDPKLNWTHYYGYARHSPGASASNHWTFTLNRYEAGIGVMIHELGHALGMGHGGRIGSDRQIVRRGLVYYEGEWDTHNYKPNYFSIMNYRINNDACFNPNPPPNSPHWFQRLNFTNRDMPHLLETHLDERPTSPFATQLRASSCHGAPPGYVPAVFYTCSDPNEKQPDGSDTRFMMVSDGERTLARHDYSGNAITTGLPSHPPGIDWNCDGAISAQVKEEINGILPSELCDDLDNNANGAIDEGCDIPWVDSDLLQAPNDARIIPQGRGCTIMYYAAEDKYAQPSEYRALIQGRDCRPADVASSQTSVTNAPAGWQPRVFVETEVPQTPTVWLDSETCDGEDNNGNGLVDELCPDEDSDGVMDLGDNCPQTPNPQQTDTNGDELGDVCQNPSVTNLKVDILPNGTTRLTWQGTEDDSGGFAIYRLHADDQESYVGSGYPTTAATAYEDHSPGNAIGYRVRPLNLNGREGEGMTIAIEEVVWLFLPAVVR